MRDIAEEFREKFKTFTIMERIEIVRQVEQLHQEQFAFSIGLTQSGYSTMKKKAHEQNNRYKMVSLAIQAVYNVDHKWILGEGDNDK